MRKLDGAKIPGLLGSLVRMTIHRDGLPKNLSIKDSGFGEKRMLIAHSKWWDGGGGVRKLEGATFAHLNICTFATV